MNTKQFDAHIVHLKNDIWEVNTNAFLSDAQKENITIPLQKEISLTSRFLIALVNKEQRKIAKELKYKSKIYECI